MEKLKFIYIGKGNENRLPKDTFNAIKLSKRDKEKLYPNWDVETIKNTEVIFPQTDGWSDNEVFVSGLGWKKFGKHNTMEVPVFSGYIEDWDEYLKTYGKHCLFYSLSGYSLDSCDCCAYISVNEFYSLLQCNGGIEKYQSYVSAMTRIREIQMDKIKEMFSSYASEWMLKDITDKCLFRPSMRIFMIITSPYLDTPEDDNKLENVYRRKRYYELKEQYADNFVQIDDIISKEIKEGVVFPICMSERLEMIYGKECNNLYKYILENFNK